MDLLNKLKITTAEFVNHNAGNDSAKTSDVIINPTRKEYEGDYSVVVFPFAGRLKKKPEDVANLLGDHLVDELSEVKAFNVVKGFLNLVFHDEYWYNQLQTISDPKSFLEKDNKKKVLIEYSSPNTNKPLHLGHIRNILLGWSVSNILEANGHEVIRTQVVNDRGIAICKSMLAWQRWGENKTPESEKIKPDHFVGDYYVRFEQEFKKEYETWQNTDEGASYYQEGKEQNENETEFYKRYKNTYFNELSQLGKEARHMLNQWERGDEATKGLWQRMNAWVYEGFDTTYNAMGVTFDHNYYESETWLSGKELVKSGLKKGTFYTKDDGSVWIDLAKEGMDQKIVLRSDGTSVYITQDLGTAELRFQDHGAEKMVYVVADEQNYHFQALFATLKRLGRPYADDLHHLAYGMVDLPTGRMKSREGKVVDADDLIAEVIAEATKNAEERGSMELLNDAERKEIIRRIAIAALKFFILKVNPKKRMTFDPTKSVDLQGQTGPYVQNAYVRIQSILRKEQGEADAISRKNYVLLASEKTLLRTLSSFSGLLSDAAAGLDPSIIANYAYDLAKDFHKFYHDTPVLRAESDAAKAFRMSLIKSIAWQLKYSFQLLGIEMPERM
jgi:arginyl-tRNA synthetase